MITRRILLALPAFALGGCNTVYEGKYDWREGWRSAEIVRIESISNMERPDFYECSRAIPRQARRDQLFATVSYKDVQRHRRAVPIASAEEWSVGEKVYVHVRSCEASIVHGSPETRR